MSSRIRNSNARPTARASGSRSSAAGAASQDANDQLPPYKKPSHPLDAEATAALRTLQNNNLLVVRKHNQQAFETITSTAASVNDMLREYSEYISRRQKRWDAGKALDDKEDDEKVMRELRAKVEEHNVKLEESMRAVIDSGVAVQRIDESLDWLRTNAPRQLADEYQTQMTQRATQRQSQARRESQAEDGEEDASDVEMDDGPTPGPTPLDGPRLALTGVSELFADRQQRQKDTYTSLTLTARYARNNEYRDFKRIMHDAKYGDDGPPLGHEDTWFTETGLPAPGITDTQRGDFDDDDDIIMDKATISTRCPITFQQYKEPYTSTKCPHTFEKNAILEMIRTTPHRTVACPVTGCSQHLTANDVRADPLLTRKIKRMQLAEAAEAEESSDDEAVQAPSRSRMQVPGTQQSMVEDLGDPSDDESMEQQPPNGTMASIVEDLGDPSESE
ncbi:hypothetical protein CC86DRAFT_295071 [Ophiobolus disseminans]|uniref:SP-RING-type domain-containing protein n=1 Tax=Ophiobolus disseminans TaxID=1469910 RepID=A0A6A6ZWW4_9PLEO|nr:hypothetical protein CC86DRAFT_295071 [Ophiobolus disseminans]